MRQRLDIVVDPPVVALERVRQGADGRRGVLVDMAQQFEPARGQHFRQRREGIEGAVIFADLLPCLSRRTASLTRSPMTARLSPTWIFILLTARRRYQDATTVNSPRLALVERFL